MDLALTVDLRGDMPRERLVKLRELLDLEQRGRLDDLEDVNFGYRNLREDEGHLIRFRLSRQTDTEWQFRLTFQAEPPSPAVIDGLRADIESAAEQLGLTVERVWRKDGL